MKPDGTPLTILICVNMYNDSKRMKSEKLNYVINVYSTTSYLIRWYIEKLANL